MTRYSPGHEINESKYLQIKLTKISADDILDLHRLLKKSGTYDFFIGKLANDRVIGRSSNLEKVPFRCNHEITLHYEGKFLFFCCECGYGFASEYVPDDQGKKNIIPCCTECGHSKNVTRMPKPRKRAS